MGLSLRGVNNFTLTADYPCLFGETEIAPKTSYCIFLCDSKNNKMEIRKWGWRYADVSSCFLLNFLHFSEFQNLQDFILKYLSVVVGEVLLWF